MRKILITGGGGFIGQHLVNALKNKNKITVIDNLSNSSIQTASQFEKEGVKVLIEDIRRRKKSDNSFDMVIHAAAQTSVTGSVSDPLSDASQNILGTISVIKNYPTSYFVYLSSGAVYGESTSAKEEDRPEPESPYALSKLIGEAYVRMYCQDYLILRLANIYGAGAENKKSWAVLEHFKNDNPLVIYGDGLQTRDFFHIDDLIKIVSRLIDKKITGTLNIGTGISTVILDLAKRIADVRMTIFKSVRKGELKNNIMSIDKLNNLIPDLTFKKI